ncbi:MAG TPA: polyphosphate kinase 2 family protein [Devosiaceae bacterium]
MSYRKEFIVRPGSGPDFEGIDPDYTGKHENKQKAGDELARQLERMDELQYLLYANGDKSLLIVLQALDAGGKDGTIRHLFSGIDPQGITVASFKQPTPHELAHDYLWRVHARSPAKGEIVVFNRSHYEDVLVVRVHGLVPQEIWSQRYDQINEFEELLAENGTRILKFYLHISPEEQLERFRERLENPARQWKISESDYTERLRWPEYVEAYRDAIERTSTDHAPWFVIPSNHKWFRNLAISEIVADTLEDMDLKVPPARVDLDDIRRRYHSAVARARFNNRD